MKRLAALCLLVLLPSLGAAAARQEEVVAAYQGNRGPFAFRDAQGKPVGVEADLVTEALRRAGRRVLLRETPNVRLLPMRDGIDLAVSVRGSDGRGIYFSEEFIEFENVAITRRDRHIVLNTIADLDGHSFAIWQNGWHDLGPAFEARYRPGADGSFPRNYVQPANQEAQNKMFWFGRVDVIIVDKRIFEWYRRRFAGEFNTAIALDVHPIFDAATTFKVAFRDRDLRDAFNRALRAMRKDHTYARIVARYRLPAR